MISRTIPKRILIVHEKSEVATQLTEFLTKAHYESAVAPTRDEALQAVITHRADLALIDPAVPGCEGITLLAALHAIDPALPAIIISGNGSSEEVRAAMSSGAFDFYTRPFDARELLASIAEALASRRALEPRGELSRV